MEGAMGEGHDVRFRTNQHDPDLMPHSLSSTPTKNQERGGGAGICCFFF